MRTLSSSHGSVSSVASPPQKGHGRRRPTSARGRCNVLSVTINVPWIEVRGGGDAVALLAGETSVSVRRTKGRRIDGPADPSRDIATSRRAPPGTGSLHRRGRFVPASGGEVGDRGARGAGAALRLLPLLLPPQRRLVEDVVRPADALQAARVHGIRVEH